MKKLSCSDMGGKGCNFVAMGKTNKEVINEMFQHAVKSHKEVVVKMSELQKEAMIEKMNSLLSIQI